MDSPRHLIRASGTGDSHGGNEQPSRQRKNGDESEKTQRAARASAHGVPRFRERRRPTEPGDSHVRSHRSKRHPLGEGSQGALRDRSGERRDSGSRRDGKTRKVKCALSPNRRLCQSRSEPNPRARPGGSGAVPSDDFTKGKRFSHSDRFLPCAGDVETLHSQLVSLVSESSTSRK